MTNVFCTAGHRNWEHSKATSSHPCCWLCDTDRQ